jgi:hypothetical protein
MTIEDDMRLVSTVELIAIRERLQNSLAPFKGPVKPTELQQLQQAGRDFQIWYNFWDANFSAKYEDKGGSQMKFFA